MNSNENVRGNMLHCNVSVNEKLFRRTGRCPSNANVRGNNCKSNGRKFSYTNAKPSSLSLWNKRKLLPLSVRNKRKLPPLFSWNERHMLPPYNFDNRSLTLRLPTSLGAWKPKLTSKYMPRCLTV